MAIYNEILVGRFNRALQKLMMIKGAAPVPAIAGEITPVYDITKVPVDERFIFQVDQFGTVLNAGPTAGVNSAVRLRNPTGSNLLVVIYLVQFVSTVADANLTIGRNNNNVDYTTVVPGAPFMNMDARQKRGPSAVLSTQTNALQTNAFFQTAIAANQAETFVLFDEQEIPVAPGDSITFVTSAVNVSLSVSLWWRERFLEEAERQ